MNLAGNRAAEQGRAAEKVLTASTLMHTATQEHKDPLHCSEICKSGIQLNRFDNVIELIRYSNRAICMTGLLHPHGFPKSH